MITSAYCSCIRPSAHYCLSLHLEGEDPLPLFCTLRHLHLYVHNTQTDTHIYIIAGSIANIEVYRFGEGDSIPLLMSSFSLEDTGHHLLLRERVPRGR